MYCLTAVVCSNKDNNNESFSSAQFNSYSNSADYIDCIMNVQLTGMERMTISDSVFDVSNIEITVTQI